MCVGKLLQTILFVGLFIERGGLAQTPPTDFHRAIVHCLNDASRLELPDTSQRSFSDAHGPNDLCVRPVGPTDVQILWENRLLLSAHLKSLMNPNIVVVWNDRGKALALNYSNGGAIGSWHTRLFTLQGKRMIDVTGAIQQAVLDFQSRHYCQKRGNNVRALKWMSPTSLLILTEVYPTGDCGSDSGYVEGYLINVSTGRIQQRLTFDQLAVFKGVCLQNTE